MTSQMKSWGMVVNRAQGEDQKSDTSHYLPHKVANNLQQCKTLGREVVMAMVRRKAQVVLADEYDDSRRGVDEESQHYNGDNHIECALPSRVTPGYV